MVGEAVFNEVIDILKDEHKTYGILKALDDIKSKLESGELTASQFAACMANCPDGWPKRDPRTKKCPIPADRLEYSTFFENVLNLTKNMGLLDYYVRKVLGSVEQR